MMQKSFTCLSTLTLPILDLTELGSGLKLQLARMISQLLRSLPKFACVGVINRFGIKNLPVVYLPYLRCKAEKATYYILYMAYWF